MKAFLKLLLKIWAFVTGEDEEEERPESAKTAALVYTNFSGRIGRLEGKATILITLNLMVLGILLQQVFQGG